MKQTKRGRTKPWTLAQGSVLAVLSLCAGCLLSDATLRDDEGDARVTPGSVRDTDAGEVGPAEDAGGPAVARYDWTSTSGVVLDTTTRLHWQRELPATYAGCTAKYVGGFGLGGFGQSGQAGAACTWPEARDYCTSLAFAGSGWRLPTRKELESIVDKTKPAPGADATIDLTAFPNTPAATFWTGTLSTKFADAALFLSFSSGSADLNGYEFKTGLFVRCVR